MEENVLNNRCVLIGGSAGSLQVILYILSRLPNDFAVPVIVVLHRKNTHDSALTEVVAHRTGLKVKEAEDKEPLIPGMVYLAPADYHLLIEVDGSLSLDDSEKVNYSRPSIDVTFQTAAEAFGAGAIAVLLSGANADGTDGLADIRKNKGITVVQDPTDAQVPYMPQHAIEHNLADHVLTKTAIAEYLQQQVSNA